MKKKLLTGLATRVVFTTFIWLLVWPALVHATSITLNFSTLPSAQGWTLSGIEGINCPFAEDQLFSISGGVLHQNTLGCGGGGSLTGGAAYGLQNVVANQPYTITVTARVTAENTFYGGDIAHFGIGFGAEANGEKYIIGLGPGIIVGLDGLVEGILPGRVLATGIDTSQYHTYLLSVTPGSGYTLAVDGVNIFSGAGIPASSSLNDLFLGDASSRANAAGDYSFYQYQSSAPVPEPATMVLFGTGIAGFAGTKLRRKKK